MDTETLYTATWSVGSRIKTPSRGHRVGVFLGSACRLALVYFSTQTRWEGRQLLAAIQEAPGSEWSKVSAVDPGERGSPQPWASQPGSIVYSSQARVPGDQNMGVGVNDGGGLDWAEG